MASNQTLVSKAVNRFKGDINSVSNNLRRRINTLIDELPEFTNPSGHEMISDIPMRIDSQIHDQVFEAFNTATWENKVNRLIQPLPEIRANIQEGFRRSNGQPSDKAIRDAEFTSQEFAGLFRQEFSVDRFRDGIAAPIITTFHNHIGKQKSTLKSNWSDQITGQIQRYAIQRTEGIYAHFQRSVSDVFATDGDQPLEWALYSGPTFPTQLSVDNGYDAPRPFCDCRVENYYNRAEIQDWANIPEWSGKIAGTDAQNIFVNLGGYNCRHILVWVATNRVPKKDLERWNNEGIRPENQNVDC